jgi:uncharacterized short protein YbdD (DUF466 family)
VKQFPTSKSVVPQPTLQRCAPEADSLTRRSPRTHLGARLARLASAIRRVVGAPDYERYLEHMRRRHPGDVPLSAEAFARDVLARRYERPGGKCC